MQIEIKSQAMVSAAADVLIVGMAEDLVIEDSLKLLDEATKGFFDLQKTAGRLPNKPGQIRTFYQVSGVEAQAVAIICYEKTAKGLQVAGQKITHYLREHSISNAAVSLMQDKLPTLSLEKQSMILTSALLDADYQFNSFKSDAEEKSSLSVDVLYESENAELTAGIRNGKALASGMKLCKDLGNTPGNICTPKYLAKTAIEMSKSFESLSVNVLKERDIKDLGMNALLSVAKGSAEKPRLITLEHRGSDDQPIVLVGKGVTFDTGGISLKPSANMDEMKYDMCGAATVLGVMQAVAMLNLPLHIVAVIPAVENMPSSRATKPGDIVTSLSGKTVEILNTDAEGRLILCDAMTYAQQTYQPKVMLDFATLTGAIIVALGHDISGLMSNDEELAKTLLDAGEAALDRAWHMPLGEVYSKKLESPFADLQNIGGREAGSLTAGAFLEAFVESVPWAHFDIAGTAWQSGKNKGATGRPVPLVLDYLLSQSN